MAILVRIKAMCAPYLLDCAARGAGKTTAERLLMISHVGGLVFDPAVFVPSGASFWIDGDALHARGAGGAIRQIPGWRSDRIPGELSGGFKSPDRSTGCGSCHPREERGFTRRRPGR